MPVRFGSRRQVRDWRDFTREILIIVVGVLIALGASHVAEQWTWQRRVDAAETQLRIESEGNLAYAAEAVVVGPCLQAQLLVLRDRILASGDTLDPAPVHEDGFAEFVFRAPSRPFATTIWNALSADGTVPHLEEWRRFRYAQIDTQVAVMAGMAAETDRFVGRLRVLGSPIALDAATRARLVEGIEEQRYRSRLHALMALQVMGAVRDLGHLREDRSAVDTLLADSGTLAFCREQGLAVDDWQQQLALLPVEARPD